MPCLHTRAFSLSLSFSLLIFPKLNTSLSFSLSLSFLPSLILSQKLPTQITSSLGPFFTGRSRSFLHQPINEPSSGDPNPFFTSRSFLHRRPRSFLSQKLPTQITSSPGPFFTSRSRSFLHWPIHEPSSGDPDPFFTGDPNPFFLKNYQPRSLLHRVLSSPVDPDHFFTIWSTNQTPQPRSFLHRPIHELSSGDPYLFFTGDPYLFVGLSVWVCLCVGVFLCWFICVGLFVCIWGKEDEELRLLCTEKREKNWCERKLIK